jgi:hypothetical protein
MKTILLISTFLFSVLITNAQWQKGTISYANGNIKEGYIKAFGKTSQKNIEYKKTLNSRKEIIKSKDLLEIVYFVDGKQVISRNLHYTKYDKKGKIAFTDKNANWFGVIYRGDFDILAVQVTHGGTADYYFINWPGEKTAAEIFVKNAGMSIVVGGKKYLERNIKPAFKGRCDKMIEDVENEKFKPKDIRDVINYYEENCSRTEE